MSVYTNPASATPEETSAYVAALLELPGGADPLAVLEQTPVTLGLFLASIPVRADATPEAPGKWSIRHVVQHLADSDLVAGYRFRMILAHDRPALQGYDQDGWATRLRYEEIPTRESFDQFTALRRANLRLWTHLRPGDLSRVAVHAERGEESVEHMLRLYAGHDLLHLRQLERIRAAVL